MNSLTVQSAYYLHSLWQYAFLNSGMIALAQYGLLISGVVLIIAVVRQRAYALLPWLAMAALIATGLNLAAGHLIFDPRPFTILHVAPLIPHSTDNGFPSDHSTVAAFIAAAILFIDVPLGIVAALAALAIGFARVYCLVHWPVDVVSGWLIGALPSIAAVSGWRRYGSFARHHRL